MATKATVKGSKVNESSDDLPEGYESLSAAGGGIWIEKKQGSVIEGELLGQFTRKKNKKGSGRYYQIKLLRPAMGAKGKGEERKAVRLDAGEIVNVDETTALEPLASLCAKMELGARYRVFIKFKEKITMEDGNTYWDTAVGSRMMKAPSAPDESDVPIR